MHEDGRGGSTDEVDGMDKDGEVGVRGDCGAGQSKSGEGGSDKGVGRTDDNFLMVE